MQPIPDCWPPDPQSATSPVPMFPLPGVFLFPGQLMPLHIFEPRYRQMVEDSLDGPGRLVIGTVLERDRGALDGNPPVVPTAGLGEIARHERLEDGRFLIWLFGLSRVAVEEIESERLYRRVRVAQLEDVPPDEDSEELRDAVVEGIRERADKEFTAESDVALGTLVDVLAQCLGGPESVMVDLHGETDVAERARKAIAAHARFPKA